LITEIIEKSEAEPVREARDENLVSKVAVDGL